MFGSFKARARALFMTILLAMGMVSIPFMLGGCETLQSVQNNPFAQLGVQVAILEYTDQDPERAANVQSVIDEILETVGETPESTIAGLKGQIKQLPAYTRLEPKRKLQASLIMDAVSAELTRRVGDGQLNADGILQVREVLQWIRSVAFSTATGTAAPYNL